MEAIAGLADEAKFYWSLLHTAVRLDRVWYPNLDAQYAEAEQDALSLGRKLAGSARAVATLADLRALCVELIGDSLERLTYALAMTSGDVDALELVRRRVSDVTLLLNRLEAGSEHTKLTGAEAGRTGRLSAEAERRKLVTTEAERRKLVTAEAEDTKLACIEAERLLDACLLICRNSAKVSAAGGVITAGG